MEDNKNQMTNNNNGGDNGGDNGGSPPPSPPPPPLIMCQCGCHREGAFPPGYKFNPTDEELVVDYLKKKVMNEPLPYNHIMQRKILDVNLYRHNPQNLAEGNRLGPGEKEWYFFTPRDRKYKNGNRPNRAAGDGYWKATGADKAVSSMEDIVGYRKSLVFYKGKPPKGNKTNWIMHEYRFNAPARKRTSLVDMKLDDWVLCRMYKKNASTKPKSKEEEEEEEEETPDVTGEQSVEASFDDENQTPQGVNNNGGDNEQQRLTETGDNVEMLMNRAADVEEQQQQQQHTPPPFNPYGSMYQTLPFRYFQGRSLVNNPPLINSNAHHFPQFYEDQQYYQNPPAENENNYGLFQQQQSHIQQHHPPPTPPQMVPSSAYISHPSMYTQMKANPRLMFRVKQLRQQYHSMDYKPRGPVPQYYPHQRQQHPHQPQPQPQPQPQQEQQAQPQEDEFLLLEEAVDSYNSDFASDDQNKPRGSDHDPSFGPDFSS